MKGGRGTALDRGVERGTGLGPRRERGVGLGRQTGPDPQPLPEKYFRIADIA